MFTMLETISYYNLNHINVDALILDATKAFDRVHSDNLSKELYKQQMSPLVTQDYYYMCTISRSYW